MKVTMQNNRFVRSYAAPAIALVLASCGDSGIDVLVTGDRRHLSPIGSHGGFRILTPQALLAELAGGLAG